MFKKIPLIFWAILLSLISFLIVKFNIIGGLSNEQIKLFSSLLTFVGLIFVAVNLQRQWKNERIKTEYLNQPDFKIKGFSSDDFTGSSPVLCPKPNECTDDHWFNLEQIGNLAARDLKIAFFAEEEAEIDITNSERWFTEERLSKGNEHQYKLPQFKIPITLLSKTSSNCFILLLDYRSEYSNIRYKRVYELCSITKTNLGNTIPNDWKGKIEFYEYSLILAKDSESISIKEIVVSKWLKISLALRIKKYYSYNDWILNL